MNSLASLFFGAVGLLLACLLPPLGECTVFFSFNKFTAGLAHSVPPGILSCVDTKNSYFLATHRHFTFWLGSWPYSMGEGSQRMFPALRSGSWFPPLSPISAPCFQMPLDAISTRGFCYTSTPKKVLPGLYWEWGLARREAMKWRAFVSWSIRKVDTVLVSICRLWTHPAEPYSTNVQGAWLAIGPYQPK